MNAQPMTYFSTRGGMTPVGFSDAVMMGMARDGGLLLPARIPSGRERLADWAGLPFPALAAEILQPFTDLPPADLRVLLAQSYRGFAHPDITPVRPLREVFIAELFHGPTLAFKDVALQALGRLFEYILDRRGGRLNLLGATSGDTGSAAIHGVRGRARIHIAILHPHGRVSRSQQLQMTSVLDDNVHNLAIEGTFDDCQRIVKTLFADLPLKDRYALGSVNSINWARVLAQVTYYFYAGFKVLQTTGAAGLRVAVPTGNFGDIFAGWLAARMGLPIRKLILATNENDILARFFQTGEYRGGPVHATLSPSMDIQVASNFERYLYYRLGEAPGAVRRALEIFSREGVLRVTPGPDGTVDPLFAAGVGDTAATLATIRRVYREEGYLLDPHTAVGVHVARQHLHPEEPMLCLATAHPAKFGEAIHRALGEDVARHPALEALADAPTRLDVLPGTVDAVRDYLTARLPVAMESA